MKRIDQGALAKGKGNLVSLEARRMLSMESKRVVHKWRRLQFPPRAHPLLLHNRRREDSSKGKPLGAGVRLGRDLEDRSKISFVGHVRTTSYDFWHPPVCENYQNPIGKQIQRKVRVNAQRGCQSA